MVALDLIRDSSEGKVTLKCLNPSPGTTKDFNNARREFNPAYKDYGFFIDLDGEKIYGFKIWNSFPAYNPHEFHDLSKTHEPILFIATSGNRYVIYDDMFCKDDRTVLKKILGIFPK